MVDDGAADAHGDRTDLEIGLAAHCGSRNRRSAKAKELFFHILWNLPVVLLLHIMTVNAKCRQAFLCMRCENGGEIDGTRALRTIKAPDGLDCHRVHVHGLRPVAPAGRHCQRDGDAFPRELRLTGSRLRDAADGRVRDNHLHRFPVRIAKVLLKELLRGERHSHRLVLQRFPDAEFPPSPVNAGTNSDHRIVPDVSVCCHSFFLLMQ